MILHSTPLTRVEGADCRSLLRQPVRSYRLQIILSSSVLRGTGDLGTLLRHPLPERSQ
eukprot:c36502_g1_i1 orf=167-340(+)